MAELGYLDLLIYRTVLKWRHLFPKDQQEIFKGMFISEGEIDQLLGEMSKPQTVTEDAEIEAAERAATALQKRIVQRKQISLQQGVFLSLSHLAHLFGLSRFEELTILICLTPELDLKYEKLYAYLQDDVTRKKPGVDLVMRLLCATPRERLHARAFFTPPSQLFRSQILHFQDNDDSPLPARLLKLDDRMVNYLLGIAGVSKDLITCCRVLTPAAELRGLRGSESLKTRLVEVTRNHLQTASPSSRRLIYHLYGPYGTGKKSLALGLCAEIGVPVLMVNLREVLLRPQPFEDTMRAAFREAVLQPAAIYLEPFDQLLGDDNKAISYQQCIARLIDDFSWLTFIATEKAWEPNGLFKDHLFFSAELPVPDMIERSDLWAAFATGNGPVPPEVDWSELAAKFRLTPGQMRDALIAARNHAHLRVGQTAMITTDDLYKGCRLQSNQKLATLARKLSPRNCWSDITLPDQALAQLREICAQVKHRQTVYGKWGFGHKHSLGQGLCVLFYGQSGTGKTLAVEIIATELQLDAFKIDLSTVVSKYVGETEKNLSKVFAEAETSNAILFFDEADALFGKRSEVKDAHDRYANIEINYLLQRMEEFEGLVILATNLRKNIDDAFFRRMHFAVEFPLPDENHRYRIWKQHFPEAAPVADDIDFDFLASRLNIAGGSIRNIIVNAAFLAAENSGVIHMKHLIHATRREYEKIGRLCTDAEFAPYHTLLKMS